MAVSRTSTLVYIDVVLFSPCRQSNNTRDGDGDDDVNFLNSLNKT